jgi:hypothetical protein
MDEKGVGGVVRRVWRDEKRGQSEKRQAPKVSSTHPSAQSQSSSRLSMVTKALSISESSPMVQ